MAAHTSKIIAVEMRSVRKKMILKDRVWKSVLRKTTGMNDDVITKRYVERIKDEFLTNKVPGVNVKN